MNFDHPLVYICCKCILLHKNSIWSHSIVSDLLHCSIFYYSIDLVSTFQKHLVNYYYILYWPRFQRHLVNYLSLVNRISWRKMLGLQQFEQFLPQLDTWQAVNGEEKIMSPFEFTFSLLTTHHEASCGKNHLNCFSPSIIVSWSHKNGNFCIG